jgi:hypothetical protein
MKHIPSFDEFMNESLNEGYASQAGKYLKEFDLQTIMNGNGGLNVIYGAIADALGEDPENIICVDGRDLHEPLQKSIFGELLKKFKGTERIPFPNTPAGKHKTITLDPKLMVIKMEDGVYISFFFTGYANF